MDRFQEAQHVQEKRKNDFGKYRTKGSNNSQKSISDRKRIAVKNKEKASIKFKRKKEAYIPEDRDDMTTDYTIAIDNAVGLYFNFATCDPNNGKAVYLLKSELDSNVDAIMPINTNGDNETSEVDRLAPMINKIQKKYNLSEGMAKVVYVLSEEFNTDIGKIASLYKTRGYQETISHLEWAAGKHERKMADLSLEERQKLDEKGMLPEESKGLDLMLKKFDDHTRDMDADELSYSAIKLSLEN
ncbi:hypothetical protein KY332_00655 [Candidatus Woesearchaeota archaeon]|nr:hypothetical protein [Candidatus Woesearchaeota archaeon]